jgi:DNA-binding NtrC family response regulator
VTRAQCVEVYLDHWWRRNRSARDRDHVFGNAETPFDVVLIDCQPRGSADMVVVANIRRRSPTSALVLMTAFGTPDIFNRARELGVSRVLNKPFDIGEIGAVVREATA